MKITNKIYPPVSMSTVLIICLGFCLNYSLSGQTKSQLSQMQFVDPKGYFKIVPPEGWKTQEYPQDPRGKVAFLAPESNTDLRVLVNSVDFNTTDALIKYFKDLEKRIGQAMNIEKTEFGGRQVIKRSLEMKGLKLYIIDFLVGNVDHNIQFAAPSSSYQKYLPLILKSMETYETMEQSLTNEEMIQHAVAKKLRLAQLMMELGNYNLSLDYINEGLEISPKDSKLLELKKQVEDNSKKE